MGAHGRTGKERRLPTREVELKPLVGLRRVQEVEGPALARVAGVDLEDLELALDRQALLDMRPRRRRDASGEPLGQRDPEDRGWMIGDQLRHQRLPLGGERGQLIEQGQVRRVAVPRAERYQLLGDGPETLYGAGGRVHSAQGT